MKTIKTILTALLLGLLATACEDLDNDGAINEILPGTWSFSYNEEEIDEQTGMVFLYERIIFRPDGTCALEYEDGALTGTYRAGNAVIRIIGSLNGGSEQEMLWRVNSFSKDRIEADYEFEFNGQSVVAHVVLESI